MKFYVYLLSILLIVTFNSNAQIQHYDDISSTIAYGTQTGCRGASFIDFDGDGDDDIYITKRDGRNLLYENLGNEQFREIAHSRGLSYTGKSFLSTWGDFDNDGDLDVFIGNYQERNLIFRNVGDGYFVNESATAGIEFKNERTVTVMLSDVDRDGFVDIFVGNFYAKNILYRNNGDFTFMDISEDAGLTDIKYTMGAMFLDYDNDGDSDLYITHDNTDSNLLYQNDGAGHFTDVSVEAGVALEALGMGTDFGDINNDGLLDIYVANLFENVMYINNGDGTFSDISVRSRTDDYGMGWGITFLDFNNDSRQDIYIANDSYFSPYPNVLYQNIGGNYFQPVDLGEPVCSEMGGYGTATADIDRDGFLDLVVANAGRNDSNQLFKNRNTERNYFGIKMEGVQSNRSAIGTRVEIHYNNGEIQIDEVTAGTGYTSQNSFRLHFGLNAIETIDQVVVKWPSGLHQTFTDIAANEYYYLKEGHTIEIEPDPNKNSSTTATIDINDDTFSFYLLPNIVNHQLNIALSITEKTSLQWSVYDITGKHLASLGTKTLTKGRHNFTLGQNVIPKLADGLYFLSMETNDFVLTEKFILKR